MKKNAKKNLNQLTQKLDKSQIVETPMKTKLKGGYVVIEDVIMM